MTINILNYLDESVERFPNKVAFCDSTGECITFSQLKKEVEAIGTYIISRFEGRERPIVILTERNIKSISSFFGCRLFWEFLCTS